MRHSLIILVLTLAASLYSITANAYVIHNNTGISAFFHGEFCFPCFKGEIADRDTAACPGNESGCRNTTVIYLEPTNSNIDKFRINFHGPIFNLCYLLTPVGVTAHGDVYFYNDRVVVRDDDGRVIYSGEWDYQECLGGGHRV